MAKCKDCLHEDICKLFDATDGLGNAEVRCKTHFKNKADYVEVVHGHWIDDIKVISTVGEVDIKALVGYRCSVCNRAEITEEPYCNCGAKMDGKV